MRKVWNKPLMKESRETFRTYCKDNNDIQKDNSGSFTKDKWVWIPRDIISLWSVFRNLKPFETLPGFRLKFDLISRQWENPISTCERRLSLGEKGKTSCVRLHSFGASNIFVSLSKRNGKKTFIQLTTYLKNIFLSSLEHVIIKA